MEKKKGKTAPVVRLNRAELAQAMLVSLPTIDRWIAEGCPVVQRGGSGRAYEFDAAEVKAWRGEVAAVAEAEKAKREAAIREVQAELDLQGGDVEGLDALPFRAQRDYYDGQYRRMAVDQRRRKLVETDQMRQQLDGLFVYLGDRLQTLPDMLERECDLPAEVVAVLHAKIDEFQNGLALEIENGAADLESAAA